MNKKIALIAAVIATMFVSGCGQVKVGYVDGEKVMETPQMQAVLDEGEAKMQEAQAQAAADISNKQDATQEELQKIQMDAQRKMAGIQQAYATQLKQKLDTAISVIVKDKNLDIIIDSSENEKLIFEGGIDLTDEVVQKLQ